MARPLRLDIEGGWYHVINRGIDGKRIFPDEQANLHFLELLSVLPARFGLKIHGYVLVENHYHLQLETPKANLSQAIQWLNVSYSTWFNRLHRRVGPLFQGRFKAVLHDRDEAALTINRYLHLNPVRLMAPAGLEGRSDGVRQPPNRKVLQARVAALNYRWSSYNVYVGKTKNPGWLTTGSIFTFFGDHSLQSLRRAYRRQLEQMAALGDWETDWKKKVAASVLFGSETFVRQMRKLIKGNRHEQVGLRQSERLGVDWPTICTAVSTVWNEDWEKLVAKRGNGALPAAWYLARNFAGMRLAELGAAAGQVAYPAVSMAIARFEKRLKVDRQLQRRLKAVHRILSRARY